MFKKKIHFFLYFLIKIIIFTLKIYLFAPKNCVQIIFYNETCKEFRKTQFFSNIFTFLSVICQNFEDNLRILGNSGKFSRKNSKIYGFRPYVFQKLHFFFFIKIIVFYANNLFIRPKNCVQIIFYDEKYKKFRKNQFFSNMFTFLSVIRQNFEDNLRILDNFGKFSHKNSKIYGFCPYIFKKLQGFLFFLINIILFTLKIYSFGPKIAFKAFCTSVTRQNFEYNLRILANFGKFSRKNSKTYGFRRYVFKKLVFFLYFLMKIMLFTLKIYSFGPKIAFKSFFTMKDAKSFVKINFLVKFLHF